jgi:hypothetical protein
VWAVYLPRGVLHLAPAYSGAWSTLCHRLNRIEWDHDGPEPALTAVTSNWDGPRRQIHLDFLPEAPGRPICSHCLGRLVDHSAQVSAHLDRVGQDL